jgi:aminoglycoside phosphotransferase family enzyme/predicted kinase
MGRRRRDRESPVDPDQCAAGARVQPAAMTETVASGAEQPDVFALLEDPATHGLSGTVTRIDTHGAAVFLAGADVYKVKRAVRFAFMDFATLERRRAACAAEIAVNRDNAPGLYLGVVPITRAAGALRLGGAGEVVEYAVHLRRFDEAATLDRLAARGSLGAALLDQLARTVAAMHGRAPPRDGGPATQALRTVLTDTLAELAQRPDLFAPERTAALAASLLAAFDAVAPLLRRRAARGLVRRCHGDLHLGNLALIDGAPVPFDAIEFDEAIATSDILYDVAFLLMDLCERGLRADANRLLNRYLAAMPDEKLHIEGLAALPLCLALRAAIRAKVLAAQHRDEAALTYAAAAAGFLDVVPPRLVAVGGLSGTGKTTLADAIAPALGRAPGALHLRSDVERKRLLGVAEAERLPPDGYRPEVTRAVYARLRDVAEAGLRAGQAVVVDAVCQRPEERAALAAIAARTGVAFTGLWLEAPLAVLQHRVDARRGDASDATAAVVAQQAARDGGDIAWHRLEAGGAPQAVAANARAVLSRG